MAKQPIVHAQRPGLEEIRAAREGLRAVLVRTPLMRFLGEADAAEIYLKPEVLQPVHSFKIRGVFHAVSSMAPNERSPGVSTVSAGNTAQALAWTARRFSVPARSVMPETAPQTKIDAVRALGGIPVLVPRDEVFRFLKQHLWEAEPYGFVHPWTDPRVMTGHGSLGLEIVEDLPEVDTVFVPVGGGGLLGGLGSALKALRPSVRVIAVEPAGCPALDAALRAGHPVEVECSTICDGVAVPYITEEMFPLLRDLVDDVVLIEEQATRAAIKALAHYNNLVVEGAGALTLAAALQTPLAKRGRTVCPVTGGSIDAKLFLDILRVKKPPEGIDDRDPEPAR